MPVPISGPVPYDPVVAQAIEAVTKALPSSSPYRVWRTHELRDPIDGRRHAVPLLVLTRNGLWVVHVHSNRGLLAGNEEIWRWKARGHERTIEAPFRALDDLTRRLREALQRQGTSLGLRALVLLGDERVSLSDPDDLHRRSDVASLPKVDIEGIAPIDRLLLEHPAPGQAVGSAEAGSLAATFRAIGLVEIDHRLVVGGYRLGALLADHNIWQEHDAVLLADESQHARVRSWVLPRVDDPKRRDALQRAAKREAVLLGSVGRHPNILALTGTVDHDGLAHLVFEPFEGALPLHQFLRAHPDLSFEHRLDLIEQVADALDHCHRHEITHRNLSPDSVLVRARGSEIEVRLHRFEGAVSRQAEMTTLGTRHLTHFTERIDDLYRAPEVFRAPEAADEQSDLFSLGALAWFVFTGRHPGPTVADRTKQLRADEGLRLWRVRDDLDDELDEAIAAATREDVRTREDAVRRWTTGMLRAEREPTIRSWINGVLCLYRDMDDVDGQPIDPLRAAPGDPLGHGLIVESVLGSGASARVLSVWSDGVRKALKVPHDAHAARLIEAEAGVLNKVDHAGIVSLDEVVQLSGRPCLLMQHAGIETLADLVRKQGTLALDYVQRLGEELLEVLNHLHERGITHRDIKPSNLAFTVASNLSRRLLLYDFSLAAVPPSQVQAGTPRWRDPMLSARGEWDPAADMYAAAAVMHYALTGERPVWHEREGQVRIVRSRFDPDLRGVLSGFFERAFAADPQLRFLDAADMRRAWMGVFDRDVTSIPHEPAGPPDPRLARARLDSPIGALGLSARALNALERAGVATVRDLLGLPRNRLSLVRGVGRDTRAELGRAVDALRARLGSREDAAIIPFLPEAGLLPLALDEAGLNLPEPALDALHDGGIRNTRDLAETGAERVERVLRPHGIDLAKLRVALGAHAAPIEGVLGDWVTSLLRPNTPSRRTKWEERSAVLFGLTPLDPDAAPPGGRTNTQVTEALGLTAVVFRSTFQNARRHWDKNPTQRDRVIAAIGEALDRVGPVAPIPEVADALLQAHASAHRTVERAREQAIALVRFGTEVGVPDPPFTWRRLGPHGWLARNDAALDALQALATAADRLTHDDHPTPLEAAQRALLPAVAPPLDGIEPELLVQRAVAASERAALSPRLEIYPRGLAARRAVELSAAVLTPGLDAEGIRKRVATRYPQAEPLPHRPELDALMERVGLRWSTDLKAYLRPGAVGSTLTVTEAWRTSVASSMGQGPRDPGVVKAERFHSTLQRSVESGRFRVIQVSARRADEAADALRRSVPNLVVSSLDALLWAGLQQRIQTSGADGGFVLGVDRAGPSGEHWDLFVERFMKPVADGVVDDLLSPESRAHPRLLVHPGLLARYDLTEALDRLVRRAESDEGQSLWMLLPSWDDGSKPLLRHPYGDLPVPIYKPAQRLRAPRGWISRTLGS